MSTALTSSSAFTIDQVAEALDLSSEQRRALEITKSSVVAAGAGAGKTTTLVGAVVVDLLVHEIRPERVCVCTFTRAAAANLVARSSAALAKIAGAEAPDISGMWIGTIDALCARFLREHALEAGLSPAFRVADERELRPLRRRSLEHALRTLDHAELDALDAVIDPASPDFSDEVMRAHDQLRSIGRATPGLALAGAGFVDRERVLSAMSALHEDPELTSTKQIQALEADMQAIADRRLELISTGVWGISKRSLLDLRDEAAELRDSFRQELIDARAEPARAAFSNLLEAFAADFAEAKRASETLDFHDLAERTLELAVATGRSFDGFERTYIDEAQDTSPLQRRLLTVLSNGPVIDVGDVRQALYGFRGADVEAFRAASASKDRVELADNYRSRPEVLNAINALCSPLPGLASDMITMRPAGPMAAADPLPDRQAAVELLVVSEQGRRAPNAAQEAATVAPEVLAAAARRGIGLHDVCVLVRSNKEVEAYAEAFRALGVPALAIQRRGLLSQQECLDVVHYLRLLARPEDEEALLRVLSSPFCGLSDERLEEICVLRAHDLRELAQLRGDHVREDDPAYPQLADYVARAEPEFWGVFEGTLARRHSRSVAALLRTSIEAHRYDLAIQVIDETGSRWRNVEKLLWLIGDLERLYDGPNPRALAERLEAERESGDDEGQDARLPDEVEAVRVMTIHQAKGDEFKLVVAARLSRWNGMPPRRFLIDAAGAVGVSLPSPAGRREGLSDSITLRARERERERSEAEIWRLLYVSLTRAREHLIMVASGNETLRGLSFQQPFQDLFSAYPLPPEDGTAVDLEVRGGGELGLVRARRMAALEPTASTNGAATLSPVIETLAGDLPVLEPELPPVSGGTISYSAIAAWRRCSLRRHLEHELALQPLEVMTDAKSEPAPVAGGGRRIFGVRVHLTLARLAWREGKPGFAPLLSEAGLHGADGERAAEMLERLWSSPLRSEIAAAARVSTERRFETKLGSRLLTGQIDLVAENDTESLVVDWKSGDDADDVFGEDYALQRRLYALAVLRQPAPPERVRAISYDLGSGSSTEESWTLPELERLEALLQGQVEEVMGSEIAPPTETRMPFCEGCPGLERICPVSRAAPAA